MDNINNLIIVIDEMIVSKNPELLLKDEEFNVRDL